MGNTDDCNCPPVDDVLRGRAGDTRPDCPVHDTPVMRELLKDIRPRMFLSNPRSTSFASPEDVYNPLGWAPPSPPLSPHEAAYPRPEGLDTGRGDRRPLEVTDGMGC